MNASEVLMAQRAVEYLRNLGRILRNIFFYQVINFSQKSSLAKRM
jgi:hypothetical protein